MIAPEVCVHAKVTIAFRRNGTRLHPNVWMEEVCLDCAEVLDKKRLTRGEYASKRGDE
jgi:hypothetical protein